MTTFSQLPAASALTGSEILAVTQSGVSRRTTTAAVAALQSFTSVRAFAGAGTVVNGATLPCGTENWDTLGEYNPATFTFTAASAGIYAVHAAIQVTNLNAARRIALAVSANAQAIQGAPEINDSGSTRLAGASVLTTVQLAAAATVTVTVLTNNADTLILQPGTEYTFLEVWRL